MIVYQQVASMPWWATVFLSLLSAAVSSFVIFWVAERKLREDYKLNNAAEKIVKTLLLSESGPYIPFSKFLHFTGYNTDHDALRRILLRSGAVSDVKDQIEYWALTKLVKKKGGTGYLRPSETNFKD